MHASVVCRGHFSSGAPKGMILLETNSKLSVLKQGPGWIRLPVHLEDMSTFTPTIPARELTCHAAKSFNSTRLVQHGFWSFNVALTKERKYGRHGVHRKHERLSFSVPPHGGSHVQTSTSNSQDASLQDVRPLCEVLPSSTTFRQSTSSHLRPDKPNCDPC